MIVIYEKNHIIQITEMSLQRAFEENLGKLGYNIDNVLTYPLSDIDAENLRNGANFNVEFDNEGFISSFTTYFEEIIPIALEEQDTPDLLTQQEIINTLGQELTNIKLQLIGGEK